MRLSGVATRAAFAALLSFALAACSELPGADPAFDAARRSDPAQPMVGIHHATADRYEIVVLPNAVLPSMEAAADLSIRRAALIAADRRTAQFAVHLTRQYWSVSVMQFGRVLSSEPFPYVRAVMQLGSTAALPAATIFETESVRTAPASMQLGAGLLR